MLGPFIPFPVGRFHNMPSIIIAGSLTVAFGIRAAAGVTFGLYPACRAADRDPTRSLYHE